MAQNGDAMGNRSSNDSWTEERIMEKVRQHRKPRMNREELPVQLFHGFELPSLSINPDSFLLPLDVNESPNVSEANDKDILPIATSVEASAAKIPEKESFNNVAEIASITKVPEESAAPSTSTVISEKVTHKKKPENAPSTKSLEKAVPSKSPKKPLPAAKSPARASRRTKNSPSPSPISQRTFDIPPTETAVKLSPEKAAEDNDSLAPFHENMPPRENSPSQRSRLRPSSVGRRSCNLRKSVAKQNMRRNLIKDFDILDSSGSGGDFKPTVCSTPSLLESCSKRNRKLDAMPLTESVQPPSETNGGTQDGAASKSNTLVQQNNGTYNIETTEMQENTYILSKSNEAAQSKSVNVTLKPSSAVASRTVCVRSGNAVESRGNMSMGETQVLVINNNITQPAGETLIETANSKVEAEPTQEKCIVHEKLVQTTFTSKSDPTSKRPPVKLMNDAFAQTSFSSDIQIADISPNDEDDSAPCEDVVEVYEVTPENPPPKGDDLIDLHRTTRPNETICRVMQADKRRLVLNDAPRESFNGTGFATETQRNQERVLDLRTRDTIGQPFEIDGRRSYRRSERRASSADRGVNPFQKLTVPQPSEQAQVRRPSLDMKSVKTKYIETKEAFENLPKLRLSKIPRSRSLYTKGDSGHEDEDDSANQQNNTTRRSSRVVQKCQNSESAIEFTNSELHVTPPTFYRNNDSSDDDLSNRQSLVVHEGRKRIRCTMKTRMQKKVLRRDAGNVIEIVELDGTETREENRKSTDCTHVTDKSATLEDAPMELSQSVYELADIATENIEASPPTQFRDALDKTTYANDDIVVEPNTTPISPPAPYRSNHLRNSAAKKDELRLSRRALGQSKVYEIEIGNKSHVVIDDEQPSTSKQAIEAQKTRQIQRDSAGASNKDHSFKKPDAPARRTRASRKANSSIISNDGSNRKSANQFPPNALYCYYYSNMYQQLEKSSKRASQSRKSTRKTGTLALPVSSSTLIASEQPLMTRKQNFKQLSYVNRSVTLSNGMSTDNMQPLNNSTTKQARSSRAATDLKKSVIGQSPKSKSRKTNKRATKKAKDNTNEMLMGEQDVDPGAPNGDVSHSAINELDTFNAVSTLINDSISKRTRSRTGATASKKSVIKESPKPKSRRTKKGATRKAKDNTKEILMGENDLDVDAPNGDVPYRTHYELEAVSADSVHFDNLPVAIEQAALISEEVEVAATTPLKTKELSRPKGKRGRKKNMAATVSPPEHQTVHFEVSAIATEQATPSIIDAETETAREAETIELAKPKGKKGRKQKPTTVSPKQAKNRGGKKRRIENCSDENNANSSKRAKREERPLPLTAEEQSAQFDELRRLSTALTVQTLATIQEEPNTVQSNHDDRQNVDEASVDFLTWLRKDKYSRRSQRFNISGKFGENLIFKRSDGIDYAFYDTPEQASLGYLRFEARQVRPLKVAKKFILHFVCLYGQFKIQMASKDRKESQTTIMNQGDLAIVNRDVFYRIENLCDDVSIMSLFKK